MFELRTVHPPNIYVVLREYGSMLSLAAYVHASVTTEGHEFSGGFAVFLLVADSIVASTIVPNVPTMT